MKTHRTAYSTDMIKSELVLTLLHKLSLRSRLKNAGLSQMIHEMFGSFADAVHLLLLLLQLVHIVQSLVMVMAGENESRMRRQKTGGHVSGVTAVSGSHHELVLLRRDRLNLIHLIHLSGSRVVDRRRRWIFPFVVILKRNMNNN